MNGKAADAARLQCFLLPGGVNCSVPSLLRCYAEWQQILSRPVEEICNLLCSDSDNAQRLRQNSPFAGLLSPTEVWDVKSRFRHASATA